MNNFSWYNAKSIEDALTQVNSTASNEIYRQTEKAAILKAGGTDLLDLMKEGLLQPKTIVNIRELPGLDKIEFSNNDGLRVGANSTLAEIAAHEDIRKHYIAFAQAAGDAATPQLRNMATIGGNIAQRTRCWYFRSYDHPCFRKGGDRCFAKNGENENHAILNNGSCVSVHASSVSTALMAYDARVVIVNSKNETKEIPIADFFVAPGEDPLRETILEADEIITHIRLAKPASGTKAAYIKQGARESHDWSIADVAVVLEMNGKTCKRAAIALGAASPVPLRSMRAEGALAGNQITDEIALEAATLAMERARPLAKNGYKVPLFINLIQEAILNAS
ncbi:MAG TPA: FAD binding domain-containing protein [Saprospiraceae bacterium]|nr:FAD binding domain-containing protein [Saprospiraceae bacterium]HPG07788.1 FAD binding domain-containing protein [Saprospiraceae bacterium]HPR01529.1 FAD binding domain-containing protein [Saprospiraceae bacterium]HRV84477.1 FAD binding domain-containing protein [Saprospiraceae bacterium]